VTRTALLVALTLAIQSVGVQQTIVGPTVNMLLILGVMLVGVAGACAAGAITPITGLWAGILAPPLAPMVPLIGVGNAVMCLLFWAVSRALRGIGTAAQLLGVLAGSLAKYAILTLSVRFVVEVPPPVAAAMGSIQLVNALIGGVVALAAARVLERTGITAR
jgi:hypothetical protein